MKEQNNMPSRPQVKTVNIMEYVAKLWEHRKPILKCCGIGAIIGLVVGFSLPNTYKAGAMLSPETEQKTGSGVSSIASMMGVTLNNSVDAISFEMYPDVVHSTPFIVELFDLPVEFERGDSVIHTTLIDYMLEYQKKPWWSAIIQAPFELLGWCVSLFSPQEETEAVVERNVINLNKDEREIVKFFAKNIFVNVDKKSGKTEVELEMQDPLVVHAVVQAVLDNLKKYMTNYRTSKASQDVANLSVIFEQRKADYHKTQQAYAQYVDANKKIILQSARAEQERLQQEMNLAFQVYSQVATQLEGARIKEQEAKPVFTILEPAVIPNRKSGPSKAKMLFVFTFMAGFAAATWFILREDLRKNIKEITGK